MAALCVALRSSAAGPEPGPVETFTGHGAAGVMEVGRPLDVVRGKAAREARERAIADLLGSLGAAGARPGLPARDVLEARVRKQAGDPSLWKIEYWSNGAVTASLTVPVAALVAQDGKD